MVYSKEVIIIGGGISLKPYISLLQPLVATKFTILINYAYRDFKGNFLTFLDRNFYVPDYAKNYVTPPKNRHPDIYEELKKLPLIVGCNRDGLEEFKLDNTILLNKKYRTNLTGIFALKLLELLEFKGIIYLLGFDWGKKENIQSSQIHYYDLKHKGSSYIGYYENHNPNKDFAPFIKKEGWNIYNVSLESNINCFEKISYVQFFKQLSNKIENQEELRNFIKEKLLCI